MVAWLSRPLADIAAALRERRVDAMALWEEAADRHRRLGRRLDAYAGWDAAGARALARVGAAAFKAGLDLGPLQGIPVSVKDLFGVPGMATHAGSPRRLPAAWERAGPVIGTLRRQAPIVVGKTHMVEFAFGGIGINSHWGTPRNPWDGRAHRVPGGSSSGAGVSLAEGSALVALGSDTAGSVRIPAAMTGCVGLKLTAGRWSTDGLVPLSPTFDTPGILTRTVADAIFAFRALDPGWQGGGAAEWPAVDLGSIRIGVARNYFWDGCSPGIAEEVDGALRRLARAGARVREKRIPEADQGAALIRAGGVTAAQLYAFLKAQLPAWLETLDPLVAGRVKDGRDATVDVHLDRLRAFGAIARSAVAHFADCDVLATPTVPITPPKVAELATWERYAPANGLALRNTGPVNWLGLCAISLPVGRDRAGMPVGLQLMAPGGAEERLLAIALAVERRLGTAGERLGRPPLAR